MRRKRFSKVLGCILALAILAGIAIPFAGSAAGDFELTVLNPKADFDQIDSMPLADREPLLNKLKNKEQVDLFLLTYQKMGSGNVNEAWAIALALKDYWVEEYGYTDPNKITITGVWNNSQVPDPNNPGQYLNSSRYWKELGIPPPLGTPWGTKSGKNFIDGMPLTEDPFERYQNWAEFDAVLVGTAD